MKNKLKLKEVKNWKRKQFLLTEMSDYEEDVYDFIHDKYDMNTCDKCDEIHDTERLVWITAEDFIPTDNEILPADFYERGYDALCEECYIEEIKKEKGDVK